jgi:hypothetical protein
LNQEINPSSKPGSLQYEQKMGRSYDMRTTAATHFVGGAVLHLQILAAVRAGFGITLVGLAAIEAGGPRRRGLGPYLHGDGFPSFVPVNEVEGKEDDQEEEDANGPEKALPECVPVLLGIKKNPEGHDQRNHVKKDEKETHSGFPQKQRSAVSYRKQSYEFRVPNLR